MTADETPAAIDLAREPDFSLGGVSVRPSKREVVVGDTREMLEPRVMQALVALARQQGEVVSRDALIATCWDGRIVGDDAINGCVAKVRRLGETSGAFAIETIPRVGYRLAPNGAKAVRRSGSRPWVWAALAGALFVVVAGVTAWTYWPAGPVRVVVQPFAATPADKEGMAVAARVRDQIAGVLAARQVDVASNVISKHRARLVVAGTVEHSGDAARVRVHIDDPKSGLVLWQSVFEGSSQPDGMLAEQVAAKVTDIANAGVRLLRSGKGRVNNEALKAWMFGFDAWRDGQVLEPQQFYRAFRDAAPDVASAQLAFANATLDAISSQPPETAKRWQAEVEAAAKRAHDLDPNDPDGYLLAAQLVPNRDYVRRHEALRKGLSVAPDYGTLLIYEGLFLFETGHPQRSVPYLKRGLALDPLSPPKNFGTAYSLAQAGHVKESRVQIANAGRIWPHSTRVKTFGEQFAVSYSDPDDGPREIEDLRRRFPEFEDRANLWASYFASLKCGCGQGTAADKIEAAWRSGKIPPELAVMSIVRLGDLDRAYAVAWAVLPSQNVRMVQLAFSSTLAPLRRQPRFMELAEHMGLVDYWRATGEWPEYCAEPGLPYNCKVEAARVVAARGKKT